MADNSNGFISGLKTFVFAGTCLAALLAFAATRKVTIFNSGSGIHLQNGSDVTVSYDVACYDKSGASTFSLANQTLAKKTKTVYPAPATCADQSSANYYSGAGLPTCGPYESHSAAQNNCGSGYTICSFSQYAASTPSSAGSNWLSVGGLASTWSYSVDGGSNWTDVSLGGTDAPKTHYSATYRCASAAGGSGTVSAYCTASYTGNSSEALCCPQPGTPAVAESCDVTVTNTGTEGYLKSPQFKGGSPF